MSSALLLLAMVAALVLEVRRRRQETHAHAALLQAIQAPPSLLVMVADVAEKRIIAVNHAFAAALGRTPDEMRGQSYLDYVHPEDLARTADVSAPLDADHFDNRYRHAAGGWVTLRWLPALSYHVAGYYGFSAAQVLP